MGVANPAVSSMDAEGVVRIYIGRRGWAANTTTGTQHIGTNKSGGAGGANI